MKYKETVEYILNIPKFTKKNPMDNTKKFMELLGNPQDKIKTIHIVGTNGKGSTVAFLTSVLREAGYKCGMFTSPHLEDIRERFRIDGELISEAKLVELFKKIKIAIQQMEKEGFAHPTFFECIFAIGVLFFYENNVDYALIEAGMGGLTDTTNCLKKPEISIITTIGLDHTQFLGNTIKEIAREKAGIIKKSVPVIFDGTKKEVKDIIMENILKYDNEYFYLSSGNLDDIHSFWVEMREITNKNIDFLLNNGYYGSVSFLLEQIGDYQMKNAALAIMAARTLKINIDDNTIYNGIKKARWEGRMECVLPDVYIDGAHNQDGIMEFIKTAKHYNSKENVLLFSAVSDKDYSKMIEDICKQLEFKTIVVTKIDSDRATNTNELASIFKLYGKKEVIEDSNIETALKIAIEAKKGGGLLFCVGSLYLIGSIKTIIRRIYND